MLDSEYGKKVGRGAPHFRRAPPGMSGLELRLPYLFSEGVKKNRISLNQFVALTATNSAKIQGLHPRKGTIAVGSDADIAIWDPDRKVTVTQGMHDNVDCTPYDGKELNGWPETVISRGEAIVANGEFNGEAGRGEYLERPPPNADPAGGRIA